MLRFVLILLLIYFAIRLFSRIIIIRTFKNQYQNRKAKEEQKPEGTITVQPNKTNAKLESTPQGDYIDYEELK